MHFQSGNQAEAKPWTLCKKSSVLKGGWMTLGFTIFKYFFKHQFSCNMDKNPGILGLRVCSKIKWCFLLTLWVRPASSACLRSRLAGGWAASDEPPYGSPAAPAAFSAGQRQKNTSEIHHLNISLCGFQAELLLTLMSSSPSGLLMSSFSFSSPNTSCLFSGNQQRRKISFCHRVRDWIVLPEVRCSKGF